MEIRNKNQNLYVLKASTIGHSDIQDLPVGICKHRGYIKFSVAGWWVGNGEDGCDLSGEWVGNGEAGWWVGNGETGFGRGE